MSTGEKTKMFTAVVAIGLLFASLALEGAPMWTLSGIGAALVLGLVVFGR